MEERLNVHKIDDYDIIVVGGGVSGVAASLAARRSGCKVLLIEKSLMLGGLATLGLINYFEPLCNGRGRKIIGGICEELLRLAIKYGYDSVPEPWLDAAKGKRNDINPDVHLNDPKNPPRYVTRFSPAIFAMALTDYLTDEGVNLLYDTLACKPVMKGGYCTGVIVENKSGREFYAAKYIIDTTGDADILHRAGVPTVTAHNWFSYWGYTINRDTCNKSVREENMQYATEHITVGSNLYGKGHPEHMKKYDGTNVNDITEYVISGHKMMLEKIKCKERHSQDISTLPGMPQFRTTRRIVGDYELNEQDRYIHFEDSIGAVCDFTKRDIVYEIPYGCLYNNKFKNLITAGRSISSSGWAWDVTRVIPPAILTGQAAGQAVAVAMKDCVPISKVPLDVLQHNLEETGVIIHF